MSSYVKFAADAGEQYLSTLAESQENFLKAISAYSEWATKVPTVSAPELIADLPTPAEVTEASFAFATKLLKQQKSFSDKLLATIPAAPTPAAAS